MPDRTALITGASSGIGLALARTLGEEHHALTITSRTPDKLAAAAAELRVAGYDVHAVPGNVVKHDDIEMILREHERHWGTRMDVLVNNAGGGITGSLDDLAPKYIDVQLNLNLRSVILVTKQSLPFLRVAAAHTGSALVINISSMSGKVGTPGLSVYSAAKFGVVGFTQALNSECGGDGIRATVLCPEFVDTPLTEIAAIREALPGERMITVDDLARAVRCLLAMSRYCVVPEIMFNNVTVEKP